MTHDGAIPLCVDLDGTLIATDTLHESLLLLGRESPVSLASAIKWIKTGKAAFKQQIAARVLPNAATLPYRSEVLTWLQQQRAEGRSLVLVTAADQRIAHEVASHLNLFDAVIASDGTHNLSGETKRRALVERYGEKGFDYAGNDHCDLAVWRAARRAVVVGSTDIVAKAKKLTEVEQAFITSPASIAVWLKALRIHQWLKNVLVFLPALLAHRIMEPEVVLDSLQAFMAFCLCASTVYMVNDLLDLESDRLHPRKRLRPFAAGTLPTAMGVIAVPPLLLATVLLALSTTLKFCLVLASYYVLTWLYSLQLKRIALLDVMALATLYTIRIIGGAAATRIPLSFWLLAFSVFIFLSLGFVKRYTELHDMAQSGRITAPGRGYSANDLPLMLSLGTAAGYCTVVVTALYINSPDSQALYAYSKPLWLICPMLLFWISRVWLLTTRGEMHDDPLVFALRDRVSLVVLMLLGLVVLLSTR